MAKGVPDTVMDDLLDRIATATLQSVVSDEATPTDLTGALADVAMAPADYTIAQGDAGAGSRKITMAAKSDVEVDAAGTPNHVVLSLTGTLLLITTCSGPDLSVGSTVDFPGWKYEIGIPT